MVKGWLSLALFLFLALPCQGQLNAYKYFVVPVTIDGMDQQNPYNISTLLKYLAEKEGLPVHYEGKVPPELLGEKCKGSWMALENNSNSLTTRVRILFKDCKGATVFTTRAGSSKIKDYKEAYEEAIREAFRSVEAIGYRYEAPKQTTVSFKNDVKRLPPAKDSLKDQPVEETPPTWYAQEKEHGFQVVDKTPEVRMQLWHTSREGIFIARSGEHTGILYPEGAYFVFEYYADGERKREVRNIKF